MDTETIFAIAGVGLTVALLNMLLSRSGRDDAALAVSIVGLVAVLFAVVREVSALFELIRITFSF
ncbi:MAG: stage III sporulation protein AC [Ruminococcaceae bacterium]|nr:stage III sporulation protein AC [Oscillospiraceae bacterium]MBQ8898030.1 stage III sporulation protein AC [Clostridia bacterium]